MTIRIALGIILFHSVIFFSRGSDLDSINQQHKVVPLFESEEPLKITLLIDVKTVKNDNSEDPEYSEGKLILHEESSQDVTFDIKVKARGNARRLFNICSFPPIKLNFKKKKLKELFLKVRIN